MVLKHPVDKSESVNILFCGLLRNLDMFEKTLYDLVLLRREGLIDGIYFSTWKGEVQQYPDVFAFFKKWNIKLIESDEPEEVGEGHIWCQMKSMEEGLKEIPKDSFVLKTRSDVYINPAFLRKLFTQKKNLLKIKTHLPKGDVFEYKVWITSFDLRTPFYMDDICFFGYHKDMMLLYNYDKSYDMRRVGLAKAHIRRFMHPFVEKYPFIKDRLKFNTNEGLLHEALRSFSKKYFDLRKLKFVIPLSNMKKQSNINKALMNDKHVKDLAVYYLILHSHFYVDSVSTKRQIVVKPRSEPRVKLDPYDLTKNLSVKKMHHGRIFVYDGKFISNIFEGRLKKDGLSRKLMDAINKLKLEVQDGEKVSL